MATEQNKEVMDKEQEVKKEEVATEATANPMTLTLLKRML
jgi:hypothetical protein